eukprot:scaffold3223_cov115-Isochrysis_galbana.AAC.7
MGLGRRARRMVGQCQSARTEAARSFCTHRNWSKHDPASAIHRKKGRLGGLGAGGLGESLGALPRGAATCDDAAPSGAHASSTADHARILAADYGGDMTDKSLLAVQDFPTVAAVGFGGLELGFVVRLDVLVAALLAPAAVGGDGDDGELDADVGGDGLVLEVLGLLDPRPTQKKTRFVLR